MTIKEKLMSMVDTSKNLRINYIQMEKIVFTMLEDYLKRQGKTIEMHNQIKQFDALLPNGIDEYSKGIFVELKIYRNKMALLGVTKNLINIINELDSYRTLLLIVINELPKEIRIKIYNEAKKMNINLILWDVDQLVKMFEENEKLFFNLYDNIDSVLLKHTINYGISKKYKIEKHIDIQNTFINSLHESYEDDDIVLFLGAGVSKDAKIATWDELISELFVTLIDKKMQEEKINISELERDTIIKSIKGQNANMPLLQTRYLKKGFNTTFEATISEILYKKSIKTSKLLKEVSQMCIPTRNGVGIHAIINYNFDDLIEKNLSELGIKYYSIYREGMIPDKNQLGIYHVHGFLPQKREDYNDLAESLLVFSEEGYHKLSLDPYNWANLTQLNFLTNNTCLFIGLSMTDPNLRRLLEISMFKSGDKEKCNHYAIMRRFKINSNTKSILDFENVNEALLESFYRDLGINILWVNDYTEIPELLKKIKNNE